MVQLLLNVIVLGFWSGTFVSYTLIVNYLSNGTSILPSLIPLILLIVAFIYPLFGKQGHYCAWNCPLGSLQELAGKCRKSKWTPSANTLKYLNYFRVGLWAVLMLMMWTGISFAWLDYELFTAFMFQSASWAVITVALLFVALSLFVQRPFCRFVCPMGTLFNFNKSNK
jgi:polyferredoxin